MKKIWWVWFLWLGILGTSFVHAEGSESYWSTVPAVIDEGFLQSVRQSEEHLGDGGRLYIPEVGIDVALYRVRFINLDPVAEVMEEVPEVTELPSIVEVPEDTQLPPIEEVSEHMHQPPAEEALEDMQPSAEEALEDMQPSAEEALEDMQPSAEEALEDMQPSAEEALEDMQRPPAEEASEDRQKPPLEEASADTQLSPQDILSEGEAEMTTDSSPADAGEGKEPMEPGPGSESDAPESPEQDIEEENQGMTEAVPDPSQEQAEEETEEDFWIDLGIAQILCDEWDSAVWLQGMRGCGSIIADHASQGFDGIKAAHPGTMAYLKTVDGIQLYVCENVIQGHNTGTYLTDSWWNRLVYDGENCLVMYTCNENWENITIALWQKVEAWVG